MLREIANQLTWEYPKAKIQIEVEKQYRNMADGMGKEPRALKYGEEATRRARLSPKFPILRGGTDAQLDQTLKAFVEVGKELGVI